MFIVKEANYFRIVSLAAGKSSVLALDKNGCVFQASNQDGTLSEFTAVNTTGIDEKIVEIACGDSHSLLRTEKGRVFGFGANVYGVCLSYFI
jgi:alpha-tubulin suppressor-like RCC1 family protein